MVIMNTNEISMIIINTEDLMLVKQSGLVLESMVHQVITLKIRQVKIKITIETKVRFLTITIARMLIDIRIGVRNSGHRAIRDDP